MTRSKRFTDKILKELEKHKYSHLHELRNSFFGLSIDFFPIYLLIGLILLYVLNVHSLIIFLLSLITIFYSLFHFYKIFFDSQNVVLNKYEIKIPGLKEQTKFAFISDMHLGPEYYGAKGNKVKLMVNLINSVDTDLVIFGGDFVCIKLFPEIAKAFENVKAKTQIGVYGNHDSLYLEEHQSEEVPKRFLDIMKDSKIKLLNNEGFKYKNLYFGGITDIYSMNLDIDKAFEKATATSTRILLSHTPDVLDFIKNEDNISLILSGHTHGGQIHLPIIGPVLPIPCRDKSLVKGLYKINEKLQLFISMGAGFSKTRMRIGTECEVCEVTLQPN